MAGLGGLLSGWAALRTSKKKGIEEGKQIVEHDLSDWGGAR